IVVLPGGTLVDALAELHFDAKTFTETYSLDILRSTDHGLSWSQPIVAAQEMPFGPRDPINSEPVQSGSPIPEVAVDPHNGNLYTVWEDARFGHSRYDSIAFSMSKDGGLTWSGPLNVNQTPVNAADPAASQAFTPSIAVGADGTLAVSYYDFRFQGSTHG